MPESVVVLGDRTGSGDSFCMSATEKPKMSPRQVLDHDFKSDQPAFYAWWKKKHEHEHRNGVSPRVAFLCASYRDEFDAATNRTPF
jgi:hypothetical protein